MGIQIAGAVDQPGVTYNKVFLRRLSIDQFEVADDIPPPKYLVFIEYRLYGVVNGRRVYHPETHEVEIADYVTHAWQEAGNGNNTLLLALPAIEQAVARLIETDRGTTAQVV